MDILLIEPGKSPVPATIESTLKAIQSAVGGCIEAVYPFEEPIALICNEEGKLQNLPPNRLLRHPETGMVYDVICGTFFLCSAPPDSEHFESLSPKQIARYTAYFNRPEVFPGIFVVREVE